MPVSEVPGRGKGAGIEPRARHLVRLVNRCHEHRRPLLGRIEQTVGAARLVVWAGVTTLSHRQMAAAKQQCLLRVLRCSFNVDLPYVNLY